MPMFELRAAVAGDLEFLRSFYETPSDDALKAQIADGRLRIIEHDGMPGGFLKFCVLWEWLPFIEVLVIAESRRHLGLGTRAVRAWEEEMAGRGLNVALVSTRSNETAQAFWRKLGYQDCGALCVRGKPAEIFLQRPIAASE